MSIQTMNEKFKNYFLLMRFDKPIGTLLLLWPTLWAVWLANQGHPSLKIIFIFTVGVIIMRAAGCVINDIADRHIDRHVKRTKNRPLTSGKISLKEAIFLFIGLCSSAFFLVLLLPIQTILLSFIALALGSLYPFTKRFFPAPQFFFSLAFAFGIPMAYSASLGHIPFVAWWLYVLTIFWMVAYDTCYAMVDRDDDLKIEIYSTAIFFGRFDVLIIGTLQFLFLLLFLGLAFYLNLSIGFYLFFIFSLLLSIYIISLTSTRDREKCFQAFKLNHWVGFLLFIGILI